MLLKGLNNLHKQQPIGVFDSGLGGITTVLQLKKLMPNEDIIYFGDTARVPYGTRSRATIQNYVKQDINFLLSKNVKMIIVACNTASTVLTDEITENIPVPFLEVVTPSVEVAIAKTKNKNIGIIGTATTIRSTAYETLLKARDNSVDTKAVACPLFVPLVENGFIDSEDIIPQVVVKRYLDEFIGYDMDTLILGCTHYPILKQIIGEQVGQEVTLIDSGKEVAYVALDTFTKTDMLNDTDTLGKIYCYCSDSVSNFEALASMIVRNKEVLSQFTFIEQVDIKKYI